MAPVVPSIPDERLTSATASRAIHRVLGTPAPCVSLHCGGPVPGLRERRRDLSGAYIRAVVLNGLLEMPPMRPTEVSDAELDALIHFPGTAP